LTDVTIDARVFAFTVVTALATSVAFGSIPALASTGSAAVRFFPSVGAAGRGSVGASSSRTRKMLVICETALAVVLLAAAGLLIRSYSAIMSVNPGFSADRVLTFTIALPEARYPTSSVVSRTIDAYLHGLAANRRIDSAAAVFGIPLD